MDHCEALIVGGGPGGSTCARLLAAAGVDVTLLEKAVFPREKLCAGWITPAVFDALSVDPAEYARSRVLQPIAAFRVGRLGGTMVEVEYPRTVSYGIRRCEFDHYLLERCGAKVRQGEAVRSIQRDGRDWIVDDRYRTAMLVGAGGHFCPVARALQDGSEASQPVVAAQEIEFPLSEAQQAECRVEGRRPELYFCGDLAGYGWCFRKGNYLNVGLGREDRDRLPEHVSAFREHLIEQGRVPRDLPRKFSGHAYVLYRHSTRTLVDDGVLLLGDAAGLACTESGEGIGPAVESGILAARAILAARGDYARERLESYRAGLLARMGRRAAPGMRAGRTASRFRQFLAARLLASRWFVRRFVIERWFLHANAPPLPGADMHSALCSLDGTGGAARPER